MTLREARYTRRNKDRWKGWMNTDCSQILEALKMTGGTDQLVLKEINPAYSVEGLMLKLQFFGHLMQRADLLGKRLWCWERLRAGGEGDDRGWDGWMASPTQWTGVWANCRRWWRTAEMVWCSPWGHKESDMTEWLNINNNNIHIIYKHRKGNSSTVNNWAFSKYDLGLFNSNPYLTLCIAVSALHTLRRECWHRKSQWELRKR